VWICPERRGHLLATGRDEAGRKQYRYHPRWQEARSQSKFERLADFAAHLPTIREVTDSHLRKKKLSRDKVLAVVVRLLEMTLIRIGNNQYARRNESYGLTTMQDEHVAIYGKHLEFEFMGKSGQEQSVDINDARLARAVRAAKDVPGEALFQYYDEHGQRHSVDSGEVNDYLRNITGEDFSAKDFRTWGGSTHAVIALYERWPYEDETDATHQVVEAVKEVAEELGNTPAICREYYIHPAVIECYLAGSLSEIVERQTAPDSRYDLEPYEAALVEIITE
jgi:DNA topoisomerase-1